MKENTFPDGTLIEKWFTDNRIPTLEELGKQYILTDYGVCDDGKKYTETIQKIIDTAAADGGGVIVVPSGTYLTGALFFKQNVSLYICKDGVLKGSDDIYDYPLLETRIEGETCKYFSALINADGLVDFKICGEGTIDGNGMKSWRSFWLRREWNPDCTNKDEQRPRLVYISNCTKVLVCGVNLKNSHFWTNHIYNSRYVKYLNCRIFSPSSPVPSPSTDAIDIDVCSDVLIKGCYMEVNDDAVTLKGGKGPLADKMPENGMNERIIVEDCEFVFCHSCFTCGSESVHNRNVIFRNSKVKDARCLLLFKMRPDTPQRYEYVKLDNVNGDVEKFVSVTSWKQFFDMKGQAEMPHSYVNNISVENCECKCNIFFDVNKQTEQYSLSEFHFVNLDITAAENGFDYEKVDKITADKVYVNSIEI